jgi:hypothetical protein
MNNKIVFFYPTQFMRPKLKTIALAAVLIIPTLLVIVFAVKNAENIKQRALADSGQQRHPAKEKMLATLKRETLDESIRRSSEDISQYFGPFVERTMFDQQNLEVMLAARRNLKGIRQVNRH